MIDRIVRFTEVCREVRLQKELMYEKGQSAGKVNVQERVQNIMARPSHHISKPNAINEALAEE
jgi:hypothetical protein